MNDRPDIPKHIQRDLLFECRYRCACDCDPVSLEKAHIIPWSKSKDHSAPNLVVLCANCHTRSHAENWPESQLRRFKEKPCALERERMPVVSGEQKAMVDLVVSTNIDSMTEKERLRFAMMAAAYAGVQFREITIVAVAPTNTRRFAQRTSTVQARVFRSRTSGATSTPKSATARRRSLPCRRCKSTLSNSKTARSAGARSSLSRIRFAAPS